MASSANNNGSVGKWEVVRRGKKQSGAASKSQTDKKSRKALMEANAPKFDLHRKWNVLNSLPLYLVFGPGAVWAPS